MRAGRATQVPISFWCSDGDSDALTFSRTTPDPQHGTATAANGVITYTPAAGYTGPDSFGYIASDGHGGATTSTFSVNVVTPTPPSCSAPAAINARPGASRSVFFNCFDNFGDPTDLRDHRPARPRHADGTGNFRTYTAGGTEGDDSFSYRATSANGTSTPSPRSCTLTPTRTLRRRASRTRASPRTCRPATRARSTPRASTRTATRSATRSCPSPAHGTLSDTGGTLVYTPANGYTGPDQFNYKACDGHAGESAPTTYYLDVVTPCAPTCTPSTPATVRTNSFRSFFFS